MAGNSSVRQAAVNPQALPVEDLVRLLVGAGARRVTVSEIREQIAAGAPTNADGTVNLIHYAAWLAREVG